MGKSRAAKAQVPECRYGAACTRKDCIFRHPPKKERQAAPMQEKTDKVCFAYVAGRCAFGKFCHDRHPDEASCRTIRDRYAKIDCQWGRGCRTEGCLYRHPSDEPVGPVMPQEPPKPQPAVFAGGPTIAPRQPQSEAGRAKANGNRIQVLPIPRAIAQAADLRDAASTFDIADPLERFLAVNARNTGTQSAALLDLNFQSAQTLPQVLDDVLPERLRMFQQAGVWLVTGAPAPVVGLQRQTGSLFDAVREYLVRRRYEFAIGQDADGQHTAFLVRGRKKRQDPLEGVRAILLCGIPGSGKTMIAEALARKSGGRFLRISEEGLTSNPVTAEEAFRRAAAEACSAAQEALDRAKSGCWWWDHAFNPDKYFLALTLRGRTLAQLRECLGTSLPQAEYFHATLAYQPTALDLRRLLGRPHRITFRAHLVLEASFAPHTGELVEVTLCAARATDTDAKPCAVYIAPAAPQWAARHLQVLNAVPLEKRILANSVVGSFKVRRVVDLSGQADRHGLCLLVHKAGDQRGLPAAVSFDASCLLAGGAQAAVSDPGAACWTDLADAAIGSLSPLVVLEEVQGASDDQWARAVAARCAQNGLPPPEIKVSRPMGPTESKMEQWTRLRPSCLLHCAAEEADVARILRGGAAALRRSGRVALPAHTEGQPFPPVVVLDRCNASRAERHHWVTFSGLQKTQVIALHLDVPEAECVARVARRGHPQHQAAALVRGQAEQFEAPGDREGFKAIVRLKGAAAAASELVRRWTEDGPPAESENGGAAAEGPGARRSAAEAGQPGAEEEEEAPAPPLPQLSQWIEVEQQGGRRAVWGVPLGCPVDAPLDAPLDSLLSEASPRSRAVGSTRIAPVDAVATGAAAASRPGAAGPGGGASCWGSPGDRLPPGAGGLGGLQDRRPFGASGPTGGHGLAWHPLEPEAPLCGSREAPQQPPPLLSQDEDAEECARQEQLAATLRCMGFDEEPSYNAALRAGGNLNVAIESVLRNSSAAS